MAASQWVGRFLSWRIQVLERTAFAQTTTLAGQRGLVENVMMTAAAIAEAVDSVAVVWSPTGLVHPAKRFADLILPAGFNLEVAIKCCWYGRLKQQGGKGLGVRTRGMALFDLPELEYPPAGEDPHVVYSSVMNTAHYMVVAGNTVLHGDTFGIGDAVGRFEQTTDEAGQPLLIAKRLACH